MPFDAAQVLQASTTKTASFNSTSISLRNPSSTTGTNKGGTPRRGLKAAVRVTAISGAPTVTFKIQHSDDNSAFTDLATQLDASFSASTGTTSIPFETDKPWVRLVQTLSGGTSPSITYSADLSIVRP
jgi:hypothetical protein